jgi:hypothetical protein
LPFFAFLCVPLVAEQSVSPVGFSESRHAIHAFSPSGEVTLPVVRVQLDIVYPRGKKERGDLVVVYDPQAGHYFWRYHPLDNPSDAASFLDALESGAEAAYAGQAALFDFYIPGALYEREHSGRADSLESAERVSIAEIEKGLPILENGYNPGAKEIEVAVAVGREFACPPYPDPTSQACVFGVRSIASIRQEGDNWRLVLRNRWDQEVILDSKFNLVSTRRLTEPAKE